MNVKQIMLGGAALNMRSRRTSILVSAGFLAAALFLLSSFAGCGGGGGGSSGTLISGECINCVLENMPPQSLPPEARTAFPEGSGDQMPALHWPVQRGVEWQISLAYNETFHGIVPSTEHMRYALDFRHASGTAEQTRYKAALAAADGVVLWAGRGYDPNEPLMRFGIFVEIYHAGGWFTRYAHLDSTSVNRGDTVSAHQIIGLIGSTGAPDIAYPIPPGNPHLHFELHRWVVGERTPTELPEPIEGFTGLYKGFRFGHDDRALYRYRNTANGDYLYTTNFGELGDGRNGWVRETDMGRVWPANGSGLTRVYRYFNGSARRHFYTTDFNELGNGNLGYRLESESFYVYDDDPNAPVGPPGAVKMYRYRNSSTGVHFYTIDWNELGGGWGPWVLENGGWWQLP